MKIILYFWSQQSNLKVDLIESIQSLLKSNSYEIRIFQIIFYIYLYIYIYYLLPTIRFSIIIYTISIFNLNFLLEQKNYFVLWREAEIYLHYRKAIVDNFSVLLIID